MSGLIRARVDGSLASAHDVVKSRLLREGGFRRVRHDFLERCDDQRSAGSNVQPRVQPTHSSGNVCLHHPDSCVRAGTVATGGGGLDVRCVALNGDAITGFHEERERVERIDEPCDVHIAEHHRVAGVEDFKHGPTLQLRRRFEHAAAVALGFGLICRAVSLRILPYQFHHHIGHVDRQAVQHPPLVHIRVEGGDEVVVAHPRALEVANEVREVPAVVVVHGCEQHEPVGRRVVLQHHCQVIAPPRRCSPHSPRERAEDGRAGQADEGKHTQGALKIPRAFLYLIEQLATHEGGPQMLGVVLREGVAPFSHQPLLRLVAPVPALRNAETGLRPLGIVDDDDVGALWWRAKRPVVHDGGVPRLVVAKISVDEHTGHAIVQRIVPRLGAADALVLVVNDAHGRCSVDDGTLPRLDHHVEHPVVVRPVGKAERGNGHRKQRGATGASVPAPKVVASDVVERPFPLQAHVRPHRHREPILGLHSGRHEFAINLRRNTAPLEAEVPVADEFHEVEEEVGLLEGDVRVDVPRDA
mmetsp:Transcript_21361/g.68231  ORF Transcript_21361/g.68231 Transcript_21361/m.68231 type:complete len:528 (-) Transcript_21361:835-2418(-)